LVDAFLAEVFLAGVFLAGVLLLGVALAGVFLAAHFLPAGFSWALAGRLVPASFSALGALDLAVALAGLTGVSAGASAAS